MANPYSPILVKWSGKDGDRSDILQELARAGGAIVMSHSESSDDSSILLPSTLSYFIQDDSSDISASSITSLADHLDSGAQAIICNLQRANHFLVDGRLPSSRIIPILDKDQLLGLDEEKGEEEQGKQNLVEYAGVCMRFASQRELQDNFDSIQKLVEKVGTKQNGKPVYVSISSSESTLNSSSESNEISLELACKIKKTLACPFIDASQLQSHSQLQPHSQSQSPRFDIAQLLLSSLTSDRTDGLFPTVVCNSSGISLGLVYSSAESLSESIKTGLGVYQSRSRGLWRKGSTSGATQELITVRLDCDSDALEFRVRQRSGTGFCHLPKPVRGQSCFGPLGGLAALQNTLIDRKENSPKESYTARIFRDKDLLNSKIKEEADELCNADDKDKNHVAFEAADLFYFALARCIRAGVGIEEIEKSLEFKAKKITRRKGDAKPAYINGQESSNSTATTTHTAADKVLILPTAAPTTTDSSSSTSKSKSTTTTTTSSTTISNASDTPIKMQSYRIENLSKQDKISLLQRPSIKSEAIQDLVRPILAQVKSRGDSALLELTAKFDKVKLETPVKFPPFATPEIMASIKPQVKEAIDVAYSNIYAFHAAQKQVYGNVKAGDGISESNDDSILEMETMPGVICKRFARPIERVGLYVPGGSAILPSTALMLGIPAQVARCSTIIISTPPRSDGSIAPEVLYVASLIGATTVLCAGGAQAVGAMAYGTESVPKVDKIVGPGNQFVTAAKMLVQNDTSALVSIDMPAGPSEVLVMADKTSNPEFVASDLLSQAEHGPDSQVILVAIDLDQDELNRIETALDVQARALPRAEVVRKAIEKSLTIVVRDRKEAMDWSNNYAPEHLIIQTSQPEEMAKAVVNAGSVFVGQWSPESCGDYASGTNHTLPTYGFARQYSGVSTSTFEKHITSQNLTREGLMKLGPHVVHLAECEGLEAHANAVRLRLKSMQ